MSKDEGRNVPNGKNIANKQETYLTHPPIPMQMHHKLGRIRK
ncbi:MAG: hypothetical protein WCI57_01450 [Candidatus Berkelbacteria bacterium]